MESYVTAQSDALIRDIILREFNRQGQVFLVYNRVETIDLFAARLKNLVPEVKIAVAHGQMNEVALENNIYKFSRGLFDVLVCSTIIENGIDMPNANTLVVCDADRLGLSQLYQLRGAPARKPSRLCLFFVQGRQNTFRNGLQAAVRHCRIQRAWQRLQNRHEGP
ncbi:MAG: helicase-related protein [Lachnospiraceae bacterium]